MARKPKNKRDPDPADDQLGSTMVLTDDDIGLGEDPVDRWDREDAPGDDEDELEEDPNTPSGVLPEKKSAQDPQPESPAEDPPEPVYGDPSRTQPAADAAYTSDQTEFQEEFQTKTGRPRKEVNDRSITDRLGIPSAAYKYYKSDATNPRQKTKPCFAWWNQLPAWAKDRILVYVYRDWPILSQPDDDDYAYIDKISGNEAMQDENDILNRYGCGSYRLLFNDTNLKGNNRTVVTLWLTGLGGSDLKSNPPGDKRISDVNQVERDHPANKSYIRFLQMRGMLPEQNNGNKKGEEEMPALVEIIREQAKDKDALVNKMLDMAQADKKEEGHTEKAMAEVVGIVSAGAKEAMKMQRESAEFSQQIREQALNEQTGRSGGSSKDPMDIALQIVQLIQGQNSGQSNSEVLELRRQLAEMQANEIRELRTQLLEVMKQKTETTGLGSLKDTLENVKGLRALMDELGGGKDDRAEAVTEAAGDLAPKWLRPYVPILATVAQAAAPALLSWLNPQAGQMAQQNPGQGQGQHPGMGGPIPGAPPSIHGGPPQIPAPQPISQPGTGPQPVPAQGTPSPGPQPVLTPAQQQAQQLTIILTAITYPLVTHLTDDTKTGEDFAEWFVDGFGMPTFDYLAAFGEDAVASAILGYAPITGLMQQNNVSQLRFRTMVGEFCQTKFELEGPEEESGQATVTQQAAGQAPGPGVPPVPVPV